MPSKDTAALYDLALSHGHALALYRLPGMRAVQHISGGVVRSLREGRQGFAFAPFDPAERPYYIVEGAKATATATPANRPRAASHTAFTQLVKKIRLAIGTGQYGKIVAARAWPMARPDGFHPALFFDKLCKAYPKAFVSLTMIPGVGLWIGASPEVLAAQKGTKLTTYSLAGTKAITDSTPWGKKEKEEQAIVTDFIRKKLAAIPGVDVSAKGPVTHEAGSLKHLLTTFSVTSRQDRLWQQVVRRLHPTPAVSGMPQARAVKFIQVEEGFDRRFYAGYLGPVGRGGRTDLFVNLRCMEVTAGHLIFYAGCGITADSDPEMEWQESERKIAVLKSLL